MTSPYIPLLRHLVHNAPNTYALYSLKHLPTSRILLGSTFLLRDKLRWWHTIIVNPNAKGHRPLKMIELLGSYGRDPAHWGWLILNQTVPPGLTRHASRMLRPEWAYIKRLHETSPDLLLNNYHTDPLWLHPVRATSRLGMSPRSYLAIRLGVKYGVRYEAQPPHSWRVDPRALEPLGFHDIGFPGYLLRQLKHKNVHNPSAEAIVQSYTEWLSHVPVSERGAIILRGSDIVEVRPPSGVPYTPPRTIDEALKVPVPPGWAVV